MITTYEELRHCLKLERSLYPQLSFKDYWCHNENYLALNYLLLARRTEYLSYKKDTNFFYKVLFLIYYRKYMISCKKLNTYIWTGAFRPGLRIWHLGGITVSRDCKIGKYCTIRKNVLIGHSFTEKASPTIEDYVTIGIGAQIVGKIKIGRGTVISNGAVVTFNTPPYSIVMGNPAKIVGFKMSPNEVICFEKEHYSESDRIPIEELEKNYQKYYLSRWKEIRNYLKK